MIIYMLLYLIIYQVYDFTIIQPMYEHCVVSNKRPVNLIAPPFIIGFLATEN